LDGNSRIQPDWLLKFPQIMLPQGFHRQKTSGERLSPLKRICAEDIFGIPKAKELAKGP